MASYIVPVCTQGATFASEITPSGMVRFTCPQANAQWVAISESPAFNVSDLSIEELTAAWGAGFTVMATGLVVVQAGRALLRALK